MSTLLALAKVPAKGKASPRIGRYAFKELVRSGHFGNEEWYAAGLVYALVVHLVATRRGLCKLVIVTGIGAATFSFASLLLAAFTTLGLLLLLCVWHAMGAVVWFGRFVVRSEREAEAALRRALDD